MSNEHQAKLSAVPNVEFETALTGSFDYSALDSETSDFLKAAEQTIKESTVNFATDLGRQFKAAQDKLANHYDGVFLKWIEAIGYKQRTVYNLIQRYDYLCLATVARLDFIEELPLSLSYSISAPNAPKPLVERVLQGDITTNKEFLRLKSELDKIKQNFGLLNKAKLEQDEKMAKVGLRLEGVLSENTQAKNDLEVALATIQKLEQLPIDGAVGEPSQEEIDLRAKEIAHRDTEVLTKGLFTAQERARKASFEAFELKEQISQLKNSKPNQLLTDFESCEKLASDYAEGIKAFISMFLMVADGLSEYEFTQAVKRLRSVLTSANMEIAEKINNYEYAEDDAAFE
ncbi:MAG: hypothetical protein RR198_08285 [Oscillospiraceae bacterium]